MSAVSITNVAVLDNPTAFLNPFQFEISYECFVPLEDGSFSHLLSLFITYAWFLWAQMRFRSKFISIFVGFIV